MSALPPFASSHRDAKRGTSNQPQRYLVPRVRGGLSVKRENFHCIRTGGIEGILVLGASDPKRLVLIPSEEI